jgi:hypothetical protein
VAIAAAAVIVIAAALDYYDIIPLLSYRRQLFTAFMKSHTYF